MSRPTATIRAVGDRDGEERRAQIATAVNGLAIPANAITLRDVTFTAAQTRDLAHGLGRAAVGYLAVNARTSAPLLYRSSLSSEVERSFFRLTHSGASTTLFDLVVW